MTKSTKLFLHIVPVNGNKLYVFKHTQILGTSRIGLTVPMITGCGSRGFWKCELSLMVKNKEIQRFLTEES